MIPITETNLPLRMLRQGKVRDVYEVDQETILMVTTDRISAFDVVMAEAIPHKGKVLTQLTAWWLRQLDSIIDHHMITADFLPIVDIVPELANFADSLAGRVMLCKRAEVYPIECVIRGYMSGSAWKEYSATGLLAGEPLPAGLVESDKLDEPLFSPATKAEEGHDENIPVGRAAELIGDAQSAELERLSRLIYSFGRGIAEARGIIIADTKVEFGYLNARDGGLAATAEFDPARVILVDEVLTPDSSRFWPADQFEPGRSQPSFDKQPLRDYLDGERQAGRWNGDSPPPPLPPEVVEATSQRYLDIFRLLTLAPLDIGAST